MTATTATASSSSADTGDPVPPSPPRRRLARWLFGFAVAASVMVVAVAARQVPVFYQDRIAAGGGAPAAEQAARRLVSDLAGLRAAVVRAGRWEAALDERDINAWLAIDLPRNHATLLPRFVSEPRIRLAPGRIDVAMRIGVGPLSTVAWAAGDLRLRGPNQLAIEIQDAGLGALPLPRGPVLAELRRRLGRAGVTISSLRLDGRSGLVVYIPASSTTGGAIHWLESLALGEGTIAFAGRTLEGGRPEAGTVSP